MENKFLAVLREWYITCEDFVLDMTIDLAHDYLFLTPHFPIFFAITIDIFAFLSYNNIRVFTSNRPCPA